MKAAEIRELSVDELEAKELEYALRHRRMKAHSALVGANRVVELYSPGAVRAGVTGVVFPANAKNDDPVRFGHTFEDLRFFVNVMIKHVGHDGLDNFLYGLVELILVRISANEASHKVIDFGFDGVSA